MSVLYPATLLNCFYILGFSYIRSCHLWTDNFTYSFPIWILWFYFILFYLYLSDLARMSSTCWIELVRVAILSLFLTFKKMFSVFHCWVSCYLWNFHKWLYYLEVEYLYFWSVEFFFSPVINLIKCFMCLSWGNHVAFVLHLFNVVYYTD